MPTGPFWRQLFQTVLYTKVSLSDLRLCYQNCVKKGSWSRSNYWQDNLLRVPSILPRQMPLTEKKKKMFASLTLHSVSNHMCVTGLTIKGRIFSMPPRCDIYVIHVAVTELLYHQIHLLHEFQMSQTETVKKNFLEQSHHLWGSETKRKLFIAQSETCRPKLS